MAIRRAALDRVGEFDARIGRKAGTLLGQEVRDWCVRATPWAWSATIGRTLSFIT
jgi:hypothetical protein